MNIIYRIINYLLLNPLVIDNIALLIIIMILLIL